MSYFSQSKGDAKSVSAKPADVPVARQEPVAVAKTPDMVSTLGQGMLITGNIKCAGSVHVHGRVIGDIHAGQLTICEGARVEGKIVAPETVIRGTFNGTIHSHSVKLQATAVVDGEIFNKSLTIETDAQFEGVARRLETAVAAPTAEEIKGDAQPHHAPALAPQTAQIVEMIPGSSNLSSY